MFEFYVDADPELKQLKKNQEEEVVWEVSRLFAKFDNARAEQKRIYQLLRPEIYLESRKDESKDYWKSQIRLNKIYALYRTRQAFLWDNIYSNVSQMFDVFGANAESEQTAALQKAALVESFDKMRVSRHLDQSLEYLDAVGEICLFVGWKKQVRQVRRRMDELLSPANTLLSVSSETGLFGVFEKVVYDGAFVEAINPINLVFDPNINPDIDDEWDNGAKIIKSFATLDEIAGNRLYRLTQEQIEEIKKSVAGENIDDGQDDIQKIEKEKDGKRIEILQYWGDFSLADGTILKNWFIVVIGRRYLARFSKNPFLINPIINAATQRDIISKRGIPTLYSIYDLCKDQERKADLANDAQALTLNPTRFAPEGFFKKSIIREEPGKIIEYKLDMEDPKAIIPIAVPLINNDNMINYLDSTISSVSGIYPNMQGQEEYRTAKATATEISVKVSGQTTRLAKDIDVIKQNVIVPMVEKVAELNANMKLGEEELFLANDAKRQQILINEAIRQGDYRYKYTDSSGIMKKLNTNKQIMEILTPVWNDDAVPLNKAEIVKDGLQNAGIDNPDKYFAANGLLPQAGADNEEL